MKQGNDVISVNLAFNVWKSVCFVKYEGSWIAYSDGQLLDYHYKNDLLWPGMFRYFVLCIYLSLVGNMECSN